MTQPDRAGRFYWDKQGDFDGHASFHRELPAGVTLSDPTVQLHEQIASDPETWEDQSDEVTISGSIEHALKRQGSTSVQETDGESRGVRVVITVDPDPQPDVTDDPEPGDDYRVKIIATRSDTGRPISREVPLTILP